MFAETLPIFNTNPLPMLPAPRPTAVEAPAPPDLAAWAVEGPEARPDRLTLAEAIELQVAAFRGLGTDLGELLAEHVGELLAEAVIVKARTAAELLDRRASLAARYAH